MSGSALAGLSRLYELLVRGRNAAYAGDILPVHRVPEAKVISVGNLRAGGSGKTPMAMLLCEMLRKRGRKVALLSRGYLGSLENRGGLVSRGEDPLATISESGDEAYMIAARLQEVTVRVGADRLAQAKKSVASGANTIVLDDGFQHRRVFRDLDLLLACPEDLNPSTKLLPAGPLRELPSAASRADLVVGLHCDWHGKKDTPEILVEYKPRNLITVHREVISLKKNLKEPVFLLAGIARPERFEATVKQTGFTIVGYSFFSDHHSFTPIELKKICVQAQEKGARLILTTEKDLPRISHVDFPISVAALSIDASISKGEDSLNKALDRALA